MNSTEDVIYAVFTSGAFFGEFALLFSQKRTATIKANTYCDLFTLSQEDLNSVLNDFPEFEVIIKKEGLKPVVSKFKIYPALIGKDLSVHAVPGIPLVVPTHTPLLDLIVAKLRPKIVAVGFTVFRAGGSPDEHGAVFFISKGTVTLEEDLGNEDLFTFVEGDHFGHYSALRNERRSLTAKAKTECQLFFLSKGDFDSIASQFPELVDGLNALCNVGETEYFD